MAAVSSFYPDPGELHRAIKEAELVLDVITREPEIAEALEEGIAASGVYRLLVPRPDLGSRRGPELLSRHRRARWSATTTSTAPICSGRSRSTWRATAT
mgnify:CR=1 FL=1